MGEGVPQAPPHSLYLSPFEPADRTSMSAHLSDLVPNVSPPLQGWRTGKKERSQGRGTRGAGKGANGGTKRGKVSDMPAWRMTRGSELMEYR